ncbi:MAG TPA: VOC family protein [Cyclobacteriaceae bacterium]
MKLGAFSISLSMKDLSASREFYENLGLEVYDGSEEQRYLIMKNGDSSFGDVRDIQKHLKTKQVTLVQQEVFESTLGTASVCLVDPDGNATPTGQHV